MGLQVSFRSFIIRTMKTGAVHTVTDNRAFKASPVEYRSLYSKSKIRIHEMVSLEFLKLY